MKVLFTIICFLFITLSVQAQDSNAKPLVKVETIKVSAPVLLKVDFTQENTVARLYKFKNAKIKKELNFSTKKTKSKFA